MTLIKATHPGFILLVVILCSLVIIIPVSAVKSVEQSLDETLTRGGRFTATITGLPNTSYYVWLPRTFSMTGKPYDQPPVIADYTMGVAKDPVGGPYPIGSYKYNNGNGRTISDDIAPSTPEMSNTQYYALVTTNTAGVAIVEFQTSINTGLRSYSVKVENQQSIDRDNLQVQIQVFSRKPPATQQVITQVVTVTSTPEPTTAPTPLPETTIPQTTTPIPTMVPTETTRPRMPLESGLCLTALGMVVIIVTRR
ncbi:MAG: hypothetical protein Q8S57_00600 [Methanoregula sp.]|nr:hypothetical protein [Methanoregula sp.]